MGAPLSSQEVSVESTKKPGVTQELRRSPELTHLKVSLIKLLRALAVMALLQGCLDDEEATSTPPGDDEDITSTPLTECASDEDCIVTGCNSEICAVEETDTDCAWEESFACYGASYPWSSLTTCTCNAGKCGWEDTQLLRNCLEPLCANGDTKPADAPNECNTCTCFYGNWGCTAMGCNHHLDCTPGETTPDADNCNTCTCTIDHTWSCTDMECSPIDCIPGETTLAADNCNTCTCTIDHTWSCTDMVCVP